jgi:hypothetical protein
MAWEPDTEEVRLGIARKELDDLKASTSFLNTPINDGASSNSLGVGFGVSSFNQGSNGDIPQQIENVLEDISGTFWGIVDVIGSLLVITDGGANEQVANQSTIRKLNGGVDGQKTVIKPAKGKTVKLINNPNTNLSTDGNLLIGADLVLTDTESITLRFTLDILYIDSYDNNDPTKAETQKIGGWIIESTGSGSGNSTNGVLKDPVKVATTGHNIVHPLWGSPIDGIGMVAGDRFLVKDQSNTVDNGIYIWALLGSTRASDMSHGSVQKEGTMTYVQDGLTQNEILYAINIGGNNITIGTSANTWGEIGSGGGGSGSIKSPVKVATTADVTSWTYNNGTGTLTASGNGVVVIDGITLAVNNRILVKDQSPANENGIYSVTTAGAVGAILVLTRSTDMSTGSTIEGGTMVYVTDGTVNGDNLFGLTTEGTVTVGTGNQAWANLTVGGANQTLSNLTSPTSVNQSLIPDGDEVEDLGSTSNVWRRLYAKDIYSTGTIRTEALDNELEFYTGGAKSFAISRASSSPFTGVAEVWGAGASLKTMSNTVGVNGTEIGGLYFDGYDSTVSRETFASLTAVTTTVTDGSEDGLLKLKVKRSGTTKEMFEVNTMGIRLPTASLATPSTDGSIYLSGTDIKVRTGGTTVNLSNIVDILPLSNTFTGAVNTFSNATGTFQASTPTVNLGTGSGNISLLGITTLSGRLQMSGNTIFWDTGLTYSITGGSSAGGMDFQIPSTAGHGFDFQLGTGVSGNPQMGIVNDEVGLNVALDMNLNPIKFQAITGVATPTGLEKRFLFSDSANSDELSVKLPSGSIVSLEGSGADILPLSNTFTGSVNSFSNATGTFSALTPTVNLGTGTGNINILGLTTGLSGRLQMNGNPVYWDSGLTYSITGGSSSGGIDFQIPSTAGHGFDFQIGTGVSGNPQMGITNTEVGLNVPLDMNLSYIKFQAITGVSAPTGLEKRFLFSDSANSDHLSVRTSSGIVDLESGGGGTSFIGFTADDNLNMGTFDVTNIDRMLFEGALGGSLVSGDVGITSDADGMIFNVPTSDDYNFSVAMATPFLTFNSTGFLYSGGTFQANTGVVNLGTGAGSINLLGDTASTGKIDMNANEIRFDGMVDPSQIVGEPQLFADSSNSDHLSIMSGDGTLYDLESSSSGANTSLSNLSTPTSINQTLIPDLDNLYSLGTSTTQWRDLHINGTAYLDAIGFGTDSCTLPTNNGNNGEVLTTNGSGTLTWSTPSSSGANTALSNLSGVSINASLTPASTSWSLGSTTKFWGSAFISGSIYFGDTTKRIYNSGSDIVTNGASGGDIKFQEAGTDFFVCDGGSDEIIFSRGVEFNEDTLVDSGSMIRSHDSIECGFSVSKLADVASIGTEGTMQIPWLGTFSGSRSATDTDFGNGHACIGIMESAGTPYLMVKSSNGGWYGIGLSLYYA